jgi:hypothetical protein
VLIGLLPLLRFLTMMHYHPSTEKLESLHSQVIDGIQIEVFIPIVLLAEAQEQKNHCRDQE